MFERRDYCAKSASRVLIARAADFAARAHATQRRKGAAQEPYINHLAEVALLLTEATGGADAELIAAWRKPQEGN